MRVKIKKLDTIANHKYARCDCKFWKIKERIPFNNFVRLKELFHIISGSVQTENYSDVITSIPYIRISDIDYKFGISKNNIIYLSEDSKIADNKILKENDLVLATIGTVGKIGMAGDCVGGTHSNNTVILRPKTDEINVKFYEKLFQSDFYIKYIFGIAAQKAQPNLQDYEIKNILLPVINKTIIEQAVKNFEPIENEIQSFKLTIKPTQTIIDEVFKKEFHFDYHRFEELKKISRFDTAIADFSNNPDLRFSAKFHRSAGEFVKQELAKITDKKIKHFLAEPIVLGASVSPSDYDENGGYHYLSKRPDILLQDIGIAGFDLKAKETNKKIIKCETDTERLFKMLLVKDSCWEYEKEWRIIDIGEANTSRLINLPHIKSITLGMNIDLICKQLIIDICKIKNIPCFEIKASKDDFKLTRTKIDFDSVEDDFDRTEYMTYLSNSAVSNFQKALEKSEQLQKNIKEKKINSQLLIALFSTELEALIDIYFMKCNFNNIYNKEFDKSKGTLIILSEILKSIKQIDESVEYIASSCDALNLDDLVLNGWINIFEKKKILGIISSLKGIIEKIKGIAWAQ